LHVTDEERLENVARELCRAAGQNPDAKIRMGQPMSFTIGDCTIVKPLIAPAWKAYCREARRLSMSYAEHADVKEQSRGTRRRHSALRQGRRSAWRLWIKLHRRSRGLRVAPRLRALCVAIKAGASARASEVSAYPC
jgi:hypothetical protein